MAIHAHQRPRDRVHGYTGGVAGAPREWWQRHQHRIKHGLNRPAGLRFRRAWRGQRRCSCFDTPTRRRGRPNRVRVNAITPGFIATPGTSAIPQAARDFVGRWVNLLDDPIEPIDVAYCALYLASDESRFCHRRRFRRRRRINRRPPCLTLFSGTHSEGAGIAEALSAVDHECLPCHPARRIRDQEGDG